MTQLKFIVKVFCFNIHWIQLCSRQALFNPFTAPACRISGLKGAHTHTCKQTIFPVMNITSTVHFWCKSFHMLIQRRGKQVLRIFKFGLCWLFLSDSAVRVAVKGLKDEDRNVQN